MANPTPLYQLFQLAPYGARNPQFQYVVLTPGPVEDKIVYAAWAYALRHTAQGLDLPDHDAALELMIQRHPSWQIIEGTVRPVPVQLQLADQDEPDNE